MNAGLLSIKDQMKDISFKYFEKCIFAILKRVNVEIYSFICLDKRIHTGLPSVTD